MSEAKTRLVRLLSLVPFVVANQGVKLSELAEHYGVDEETINDDILLLFVTGRPRQGPEDLIDARIEGSRVYIDNADEVSVPVRLSGSEAASLIVAFAYLESAEPQLAEQLRALRTKLTDAAVPAAAPDLELPAVPAELAAALQDPRGARLHIDYCVLSRDEITRRTVAPTGLRLEGRWYLDAHCETSGGERSFAVENIVRAVPAGDEPAVAAPTPAAASAPTEYRIVFDAQAAWLLDAYEFSDLEFDDDARTVTGTLTLYSQDWLDQLLLMHGRHVRAMHPQPDLSRVMDHLERMQRHAAN